MKTKIALLLLLLAAHSGVFGQVTTDTNVISTGGAESHTSDEAQLNALVQDNSQAQRDIATLQGFSQTLSLLIPKLQAAQPPDAPDAIKNLTGDLNDIENLPSDTLLEYSKVPAVHKFVDDFQQLPFFGNSFDTLNDIMRPLSEYRNTPADLNMISLALDSMPQSKSWSGLDTKKIFNLITALGAYSGYFVSSSPAPTRQSVETQLQAAIDQASGLADQFKDGFTQQVKFSTADVTNAIKAINDEIAKRKDSLAQSEKQADEIGKRLDAQSANVGLFINTLPYLVGMLVAWTRRNYRDYRDYQNKMNLGHQMVDY